MVKYAKDIIDKKSPRSPSIMISIHVFNRNTDTQISKEFNGCDESGIYSNTFKEAIDKTIEFLKGLSDKK
jgi:hypothetical protein